MFALVAGALLFLAAQTPAPCWANPIGRPAAAERVSSRLQARASAPSLAPSPDSDDEAYASREAKAKPLEKFKGGDVVVIGSSALIIILLVVLIIVIL
ncbi:MAG: hypothetical protein JWM82_4380 [Myxococcales bacterium]|nr:hypothetical protein [Myxococcales bacterium]